MLKTKLALTKFVTTCTDMNKQFLKAEGGDTAAKKIFRVYHGIDLQRFNFPERPLPCSTTPLTLLSVGNLKPQKGFRYMIEACSLLLRDGLPVRYLIVGKGLLRPDLEKLIKKLKLEKHVLLKGELLRDDLLKIYQTADIFIMPSVIDKKGGRDGIPNVMIEAMAMGIPVIGSKISAIPEVLRDRVTGLLVPPAQPGALSQAVHAFYEDPSLIRTVTEEAKKTVLKDFDNQENFKKVYKLFNEFVFASK